MTPEDPRSFIQTVCLVRHLDPLPDELRGPFVDRVLGRAGEPLVLEYVRLNMTARSRQVTDGRPAGAGLPRRRTFV